MSRYADAIRGIARRVELVSPRGVAPIVVPATEQRLIADAITDAIPGAARVQPTVDDFTAAEGATWVLAGLPDDALLVALNSFRDRARMRGMLLVITLTHDDWRRFERAAPDLMSAPAFTEVIRFEPDGAPDIDAARRQLGQAYAEQFGRLDLRGLIRREGEDVAWPIEEVYQPARASTPRTLRSETDAIDRSAPLASQLTPALLRRPLVVLGHPGAGKSFFLRWCARRATEDDLFGCDAPLPIFLPLAAYTGAPGQRALRDHLIDRLLPMAPAAAHALDHATASGRALYLLDGLDEVANDHERQRCVAQVDALREQGPGCPILLTSRQHGYATVRLSDARVVQLEPLSPPEIRAFLKAWCGAYAVDARGPGARSVGEAEGEALADEIAQRPTLRRLVEVPLLLTILAIMQRTGVRLPQHRVELYAQIVHVLVERWNQVRSRTTRRGAVPLRAADAIRLLGPVALRMAETGERSAVTEDTLRALLRPAVERGIRGVESVDAVVRMFVATIGLLVEQAPGRFGFLHLTLLEYFAALELVRTGRLRAWIRAHAGDGEMHEIIRLAVSEVGVRRADDVLLSAVVEDLIDAVEGTPLSADGVGPSLLGWGVLEDDPNLGRGETQRLLDTLLHRWLRWLAKLVDPAAFGHDVYEWLAEVDDSGSALASLVANGCHRSGVYQALLDHISDAMRRLHADCAGFDLSSYSDVLMERTLRVWVPGADLPRARLFPILVEYQTRAPTTLFRLFDCEWGEDGATLATPLSLVKAATLAGFDAFRLTHGGRSLSGWLPLSGGLIEGDVMKWPAGHSLVRDEPIGLLLRRAPHNGAKLSSPNSDPLE